MSGNVEFLVNPQYAKRRRGAYQITFTQSQDWARLWPHEEGVSPLFRLVTLPVRLLALALLWATSAPGRLLFVAGVAGVAVAVLIAH
jgi:hypothetical protein